MPATLTSSTPKSLYDSPGENLPPKKPLLELKTGRTSNPDQLGVAFLNKYNQYKEWNNETFIENCSTGQMVSNLRTGKLLLMRSVRDGSYIFRKREGRYSDNKTVSGVFQYYSTMLISEWLSSRPELEPVIPSDDDQIEELISAVKVIEDYYYKKFYTTDYETKESLSAQDFGTWITRYRYCPYKKDLICELLPFPACRWDVRFSPEESSYFIYESRCATAVLEELLDADLDDDDGNDNYGLRLIDQLAHVGGNVTGQGKSQPYGTGNQLREGESTVVEMWLQPDAYCDIELDEDTQTVSGTTIPKGRSLIKMFPEGMCVVGLNNMQTIWAIHAENHKDHIVSGVFHAQSFSGVGKGVTDAVDVMKEKNDLRSQLLAHTKTHATPGFGYNSAMVSEEVARNIGKPRKNIPIDFTQAPDGVRTINDVVQAILPGNPASAAFEMDKELTSDLQIAFQVTNVNQNPVLGVQSDTATGDKIREQNASAVLAPQHLNKADSRRRGTVVYFKLFKKYMDVPKWFSTKDKNPITKGMYISSAKFDNVDIEFEIVKNSQLVKRPYAQEESLAKVLQFTGGVAGLLEAAEMNPELTGEIVTGFGAKLSIPTQDDIARVCRKRVDQAKKLLEAELQLQQIMSPVTGQMDNANLPQQIVSQMTPPISTKEQFGAQKIQWLSALLDDDEMQFAPQELRHVIEEMIDMHLQAITMGSLQVQFEQNAANVMANAPMILGEQAMNQQNQQMQQQYQQEQMAQQQMQQQQQMGQQLEMEKQKAEISEDQAEAGHARAKELAEDSHGRAMQIEAMKSLTALEQTKNRPQGAKP